MNRLYFKTDSCPFPRPIICHWPRRWPKPGLEAKSILGHIPGLKTSPHFAQPNSIEFEPAMRWRHLRAQEKLMKQKINSSHVGMLCDLLRHGCKVGRSQALSTPCSWTVRSPTVPLRHPLSVCLSHHLTARDIWSGKTQNLLEEIHPLVISPSQDCQLAG